MKTPRLFIIIVLALVAAGALWWALRCGSSCEATGGMRRTEATVARPAPAVEDPRFQLRPELAASFTNGFPLAKQLNAAGQSAERDVEVLHGLVSQFLLLVKEPNRPPLGINEDFAKAFGGDNPAALIALPSTHPAWVDGRLVDRWGTPYHFHPRAANAIDIRSAGPDRALFTGDDLSWPRAQTPPGAAPTDAAPGSPPP
jgi:hypothetical protein